MTPDKNTDFAKLGQSRRPLDAQLRAAGKGDDQRPTQVPKDEFARNWCRTFGHRVVDGRCMNGCGEVAAEEEPIKPRKKVRRTS